MPKDITKITLPCQVGFTLEIAAVTRSNPYMNIKLVPSEKTGSYWKENNRTTIDTNELAILRVLLNRMDLPKLEPPTWNGEEITTQSRMLELANEVHDPYTYQNLVIRYNTWSAIFGRTS